MAEVEKVPSTQQMEFTGRCKAILQQYQLNMQLTLEHYDQTLNVFPCGYYVKTDEEQHPEDKECRWSLFVYPNGRSAAGYVSAAVKIKYSSLVKDKSSRMLRNGVVRIKKPDGSNLIELGTTQYHFQSMQNSDTLYVDNITTGAAVRQSNISSLVLEFGGNVAHMATISLPKEFRQIPSSAEENFQTFCQAELNLYRSQELFDWKLGVYSPASEDENEDFLIKSFPVHKLVLASRSPIFRVALSAECLEQKHQETKIIDFSVETVKAMIEFMYTGLVPEMHTNEDWKQLLGIAEKYQVESLKKIVEAELESALNANMVIPLLICADLHQGKILKASCLNFLKKNRDLLESDAWKTLKTTHKNLVIEAYETLFE